MYPIYTKAWFNWKGFDAFYWKENQKVKLLGKSLLLSHAIVYKCLSLYCFNFGFVFLLSYIEQCNQELEFAFKKTKYKSYQIVGNELHQSVSDLPLSSAFQSTVIQFTQTCK